MNIILLIIVGFIAIAVLVFSIEVLFSLFPHRKLNIVTPEIPSFVVLIPAHNESGTIKKTLLSISQQLSENDRMLVVADNCTDDTAEIARSFGADVLERTDANQKGKGFALDFGVRHLKKTKPAVVIVIDADCLVQENTLQKLAIAAVYHNRPIQALDLMLSPKSSLRQRISEFAWLVKNHVRPLGLANMAKPCQLMGTGMAFPWLIISNASLATSTIVEDMRLGLSMAANGHAPLFLPDACVTSLFPETETAVKTQKKRWEHGHLNLMFTLLPKYLWLAITSRTGDLFVMCLDLFVPPLSLLVLINAWVIIIAYVLFVLTGFSMALLSSVVVFLVLMLAVLLTWYSWGRTTISFADMLKVPFYVAAKIPLYISAMFNRQKEWVRTNRD